MRNKNTLAVFLILLFVQAAIQGQDTTKRPQGNSTNSSIAITGNEQLITKPANKPYGKIYGKCVVTVTNTSQCTMYLSLVDKKNMYSVDMVSCSQIAPGMFGNIIVSPAESCKNNHFSLTLRVTYLSCPGIKSGASTKTKLISGYFQVANGGDEASSALSVSFGGN